MPFLHLCTLQKNLLFSSLILDSIFLAIPAKETLERVKTHHFSYYDPCLTGAVQCPPRPPI